MFVTEGVNGIADASALLGVTNRRIGKSDGNSRGFFMGLKPQLSQKQKQLQIVA